ncbi:hypothetical protein QJS10_CPA09g01069 [Acorus calamus]|uniref:Endonuclease/exonuclease/phosphatase domain-containing protein n=1 Tax=Acorus calamus TaxID=4465 RepID=A0AAV9E6L3_ACOCL|nr:hypothetical protein QJS10_CPA09g01069 [Acorus calamus]
MFKSLVWNIRGINDPAKRRAVRDLVAENQVQICCLQETKMEVLDLAIVRDIGAGFLDEWVFMAARGASGGVLTCWNSALWKVVDSFVGEFALEVLLEDRVSGEQWSCVNIYGPHDDEGRVTMWEELSNSRARWCGKTEMKTVEESMASLHYAVDAQATLIGEMENVQRYWTWRRRWWTRRRV